MIMELMLTMKSYGGSIALTLLMMALSLQVLVGTAAGDGGGRKEQQAAVVPPPRPPAMYVFGDGWLDVGNNNYLLSNELGDPPRANRPYYGIDFPSPNSNNPTGRFSNGRNMADFIAMAMGFPMSPPAYLSLPRPINFDGFTGANYASADAGIWNNTYASLAIPLSRQLDYFKDTRDQMVAKLGEAAVSAQLSQSFFLLGAGTMDILVIRNRLGSPWQDNQTDVPHLAAAYGAAVAALHGMGARKFGLVNASPVGCGPSIVQRGSAAGHGGCDAVLNKLAADFNDALRPLMAGLRCKLRGLRYSVADFYGFTNATFANATALGLVNTDTACCRGPCMPQYAAPCENRDQYWFWDEGYISEQAARLSAAAFYDGPRRFTVPFSFKRLIEIKK